MGSKSNYLEEKMSQLMLGANAYSVPATVYIGLWTEALDDASDGNSSGEVSGNAYERYEVTNNNTNWEGDTGNRTNAVDFIFETASGGVWGTITYFAILDAATSGNILYWGQLTTPKDIGDGDTFKFVAGAISVNEG